MKLKILFTSDLHGYFFPTDYIHTGCRPMGVNALSGMFRAARDENTLTDRRRRHAAGLAVRLLRRASRPRSPARAGDERRGLRLCDRGQPRFQLWLRDAFRLSERAEREGAGGERGGPGRGNAAFPDRRARAAERAARGRRGRGDGLGEPLGKAREPCEAARERHAFGGAKGV